MWSYDLSVEPPAPFVDLLVSEPSQSQSARQVAAKLDSAADISAIPATLVAQLNLHAASTLLIEGYDLRPVVVSTYYVTVELAGYRHTLVEVVATGEEYMLLGRDILNSYYLHLNGPDLTVEIEVGSRS